ncbi:MULTISPECIES: HupE/UreJ family protein [Pseudoalteromonas]|uniref:HupE/UreJ protein n=1 Tax=Pseudoalteromonas amylolytica TaxID=1859457 RepID=A0A1S1MT14_9GAMM|nr:MULTISPECIES: HupE/UreJ family protein [Pseudoalteromonas]OHU86249.1 hypothetical protein BFC16_16225 [Pseudoalteromonas sp. JW3]OHU89646.1 hypothetical protein BET10_16095 [Pseudoalteromonas amylolytica]
MKKFILIMSLLCCLVPAYGHQLSTAYLTLEAAPNGKVAGQLQIRGFDLNHALQLDSDNNAQLSWLEVHSRTQKITQYMANNLSLSRSEQACQLLFDDQLKAAQRLNQGYVVAHFEAQCATAGALHVTYHAVFAHDGDHKLVINVLTPDDGAISHVLAFEEQTVSLDITSGSKFTTFVEYLYQGVLHIWIGLDHILFLLVLLITCVLVRNQGQWQVKHSRRKIIISTAWIVTAFTLAHSITLTATAMNWLVLDSRWVEVGIAISVLLSALNNIWPIVYRLAGITFAFGLLHGMGFAGVLSELGLPADLKLLSVLAFNLGVEVGQLSILAVALPILISLRTFSWYRLYFVRYSSLLIAVIALQWTVDRL